MSMPKLGLLATGQEVVIAEYGNNDQRLEYRATVEKIGRDWVDFRCVTDQPHPRTWRLRKSTQTDDNRAGRGGPRFYTLEQHAWVQRRNAAALALRDAGIDLRGRWDDDTRMVALADFVTSYDAEHTDKEN